jgi:hypothetical protein
MYLISPGFFKNLSTERTKNPHTFIKFENSRIIQKRKFPDLKYSSPDSNLKYLKSHCIVMRFFLFLGD